MKNVALHRSSSAQVRVYAQWAQQLAAVEQAGQQQQEATQQPGLALSL